MTAPVLDPAPVAGQPEGTVPIRLPVMVVEGLETSDGRYIAPGALSTRSLPIGLYAQTRATHGDEGDAATWLVGAITEAHRRPGPEVTQLSTGLPFPEGTFVWEARGWMYRDVPAAPEKSAYQLVRDGALRGNSVDLSGITAEFVFPAEYLGSDPAHAERIVMVEAAVAASTLVGQPAFPDAYIELDGITMEPAGLTAAGTDPAWSAAELGDDCSPCLAGDTVDEVVTAAIGDDYDPEVTPPQHTGGMVALIPANPNMLVAPGGDPADELHLTLAYLGDNVAAWPEAMRNAVHEAVMGQILDLALPYTPTGNIFSHAVFNPASDEPATVYMLDGTDDRRVIDKFQARMASKMLQTIGEGLFPEQHSPFVPHITAGYGLDPKELTYTGPVVFDRVRVALAGDVYDYPLAVETDELDQPMPLVASAVDTLPPVDIFANPQLTGPTAPTVTDDGRAYGHLACWGTCHIGFAGKCVTPPRNTSGYAYFLVHSTRARDADGNVVTLPVGYGTIGTGHAELTAGALAAAEHYDNTGTAAFEYNVGEDEHGIWFAGRLLPGLTPEQEVKARGTVFSGDWRQVRGKLELVASLGVNTPGFPVPRVRVASGAPLALVAAGVPAAQTVDIVPSDETLALLAAAKRGSLSPEVSAWLIAQYHQHQAASLGATIDTAVADVEQVAHLGVVAALDLALDGELDAFVTAALAGTLHLPPYIKRIATHLERKGMTKSHAIASAVNAAKKMCETGDLNFPGSQDVNPGSRAEACEAVAQWKADRPGAR